MSEKDQPRTTFEIVAGKRIGPFRLGMTRAQAREVAERDLGTKVSAGATADAVGDTGIIIYYDEKGRCQRVSAAFEAVPGRYAFTLFGEDICNAEYDLVTRLCKAHWSFVNCEAWGIGARSAGFEAFWPAPYEYHEEEPEYFLQRVTIEKPDLQAFLFYVVWSIAGGILYVLIATAGGAVFVTLAGAARDVRFIGDVVDGFTIIVLFQLFLFEWRRIEKWLIQGDFVGAIASVAVNLILVLFALGAIASAAKQIHLSESLVTALALTLCVLTLAWLLHIVWKIGRAIYSRANWSR